MREKYSLSQCDVCLHTCPTCLTPKSQCPPQKRKRRTPIGRPSPYEQRGRWDTRPEASSSGLQHDVFFISLQQLAALSSKRANALYELHRHAYHEHRPRSHGAVDYGQDQGRHDGSRVGQLMQHGADDGRSCSILAVGLSSGKHQRLDLLQCGGGGHRHVLPMPYENLKTHVWPTTVFKN